MHPVAESEAKVAYKEPLFVYYDYFFMTAFTRKAPIEENTASKCIHTVVATYGCKISQLYEYETNEHGYEANGRMTPQEYQYNIKDRSSG